MKLLFSCFETHNRILRIQQDISFESANRAVISIKEIKSCVLKASVVEGQLIPSIDPGLTVLILHQHLGWNPIDSPSTSQSTIGQESSNFRSIYESVDSWPKLIIVLKECQPSIIWDVDQLSIDWHLTMDRISWF